MSIVNEAELILRLKNPETRSDAFSMLVRTYQERLYWHIRKMVISHDDAGDVLQNTLLKAWNGIEKFRGESLISTWLYRIATNETLSFLDNKRSRLMSNIDEVDDFLLKNLAADEYFDGNELETKLQKAIISLPDKQRLVFNMFVGILEVSENFAFLISDNRVLTNDIFIPKSKLNGGKNGQKAVVKLLSWEPNLKNPVGEVVDVLGEKGNNDTEMHEKHNRAP